MARESVTIVNVADKAGVSRSSAARVLAGKGSASPATRAKVLDAASALGYRRNELARAMKSGSRHTIGIVVPDVTIPFFSAVLRGLADNARAAGYEVLVSNTDNDADVEARSLELLAGQRVDGIAIAPVFQKNPKAVLRLVDEGMPVVLLDRRMPGLEHLPLVSVDHADAADQATRALTDLGHERIALLAEASPPVQALQALIELSSGDPELSVLRPSGQRVVGYLRGLHRAGIELDEELIIQSGYTSGSAEEAVTAFLRHGTGATALHATNAVLSSGAYRGLRAQGLALPEDLSFIGFDDQEWTRMVEPAVTVVEQPRQRLGATAVTVLTSMIHGVPVDPVEQLLKAEVLMRESAAAPGLGAAATGQDPELLLR